MTQMWEQLQEAAQAASYDVQEIKRELDPRYVLSMRGHDTVGTSGGRALYLCPFHPDHDPSFAVWTDPDGIYRIGCWSCEKRYGDVGDLLAWFGEDRPLDRAHELLLQQRRDGFAGPVLAAPEPVDIEGIYELATETWPVELYCNAKETAYDARFLRSKWSVLGMPDGDIVIPHYTYDRRLVGLKHRNATTKTISYRGSSFRQLYGEWHDTGQDTIILCEGESDTWLASFVCDDWLALGLPSGGNQQPSIFNLERFRNRRTVFAFDADNVGRTATQAWLKALDGIARELQVVPLPEDSDLSDCGSPLHYIEAARVVRAYNGRIREDGQSLVRSGEKSDTPVSNWRFEPIRQLVGRDISAYEGVFHPGGKNVILTTEDLVSPTSITRWCNSHGGSWYGNQRDVQEYLALLQSTSVGLLHGNLCRSVGLHGSSFVLPDRIFGPEYWRYIPPTADIGIHNMIHDIPEGGYEVISALLHLHTPEVIDPILAWLALSPLRTKVREFPILAITGASGTGKTTLTETILKHFTSSVITTNLTATTPYAVDSFVSATNALPVWFDEYRPGARADTIDRLEQVLRDAYTSQPSFKGGQSSNLSHLASVTPTAPIIVSGEDVFAETSHVERMVLVSLPTDGRDSISLTRLNFLGSFRDSFISWLLLRGFDLPAVGIHHNNPRICTNLSRLAQGWSLLREFVHDQFDQPLRDPDFSRVITTVNELSSTSPILELIQWGSEWSTTIRPVVWATEDGDLCVSIRNLLMEAKRNGTFKLPGNAEAIRSYLRDKYRATEQRVRTELYGHVRVMLLPGGADLLK